VPYWLAGGSLGIVAAKAALMYAVAVIGLRLAQRRTLAQWTAIDFAAAVAVGALVGRTAVASGQSFAAGAIALLTILLLHALATLARRNRAFAKVVDHRIRVLVEHGVLQHDELVVCGLTDNDVLAKLREKGVRELSELRWVLYETKGDLTIVRAGVVSATTRPRRTTQRRGGCRRRTSSAFGASYTTRSAGFPSSSP
jgi:uncharacterized membrane protein YcaP (DUF421 family)